MQISIEEALKAPKKVAVDLETTGLNYTRDSIITAGIYGENFKHHIRFDQMSDDLKKYFCGTFFKDRQVIYHHAKFDMHFIEKFYPDIYKSSFACTMIISQIIDNNGSHSLEVLADLLLPSELNNEKHESNEFLKKNKTKDFTKLSPNMLGDRVEADARNTYLIFDILRPRIYSDSIYAMEKEFLRRLLRIESVGVKLDKAYLKDLEVKLSERREVIARQYHEINLDSDKQVRDYLYTKYPNLPILKQTPKGKPSVDIEVLEKLNLPDATAAVEHRHLTHTLSTFVTGLLERLDDDDRLHCKFNQLGARTGRLSCEDPNLQQIPDTEEIRRAFFGNVSVADYSQMEAILYACLNDDVELLEMIDAGVDLYIFLAAKLYGKKMESITDVERVDCKRLFLAKLYGLGRKAFEIRTKGIPVERVESLFSSVQRMFNSVKSFVEVHGYVETQYGRRRLLHPNRAYIGVNTIVQGTAADILKRAINRFPWSIVEKCKVNVHDELVFVDLTEEEKPIALQSMILDNSRLKVSFGSGSNWFTARDKNVMKTWGWKNGSLTIIGA